MIDNNKSILIFCIAPMIFSVPTTFADEPVETQSHIYKKTEQAELPLVVYLPKERTNKRPAIVFFFGGGWAIGRIKQFEPQAQYFAGRGLVAICAEYRVKSRHNVAPDACIEDAKSTFRWVRKNADMLGVDANRIVGAGGSAGGHIAACAALCDGCNSPDDDLNISCAPNVLVLFNPVLSMTDPKLAALLEEKRGIADTLSPTLQLKKDSPPTLLLYGTEDRFLIHGEEFMKRSKELGHHAEIDLAEGAAHGYFNRPPWLQKTIQRADQFLVSLDYLKPANPGDVPKE